MAKEVGRIIYLHDEIGQAPNLDDRIAAQLRVIPLLDGSIEGVHVHMDDFSHTCRFTHGATGNTSAFEG